MSLLRRLLPATSVQRARLGAMVFAVLSVLPLVPQIDPTHPPIRRIAAALALLLLVTDYVVTYLRGRAPRLDWLLVGATTMIGGTALLDPVATTAICVSSLATQSQFGSNRSAYARLATLSVVFPVTIAISPMSLGRHIDWYSGAILSLIPHLLMIMVMVRVLHSSLARQQLTIEREVLLSQTGRQLIHCTELDAVRAIAAGTAEALCAQVPGTALLAVSRDGDGAVVEDSAGLPESMVGRRLPANLIAGVESADGQIVSLDRATTATLADLTGRTARWRGVVVPGLGSEVVLLVGMARKVPDEVVEAFRSLRTQRSLAEANCGAHAELDHQAHTDQLTALPNRAMFFRQLAETVDGAVGVESDVALLLIDLDDFKQVNDVYGHAAGDQLLVEVAARLIETGGPTAVPARFGGDEFAVLLPRLDSQDSADRIADELRERLREPVRLTQATVRVGASIGIAGAAPDRTAADLMRCADIAMYAAKAQGKNRVQRFTATQHGDLAQVRLMEDHLAHAVARDEIIVRYQPMIEPATGRCAGVEAGMVWRHPTVGTVPGEEFLAIAERGGTILQLGAHVLRTACGQVGRWRAESGMDLRVAVTVSPHQLNDPGFVALVRDTLAETGVPPGRLTLQLRDQEAFNPGPSATALEVLAEHGVRIAIDEVGARSVSLATLETYPVHQIKIKSRTANDDESLMFEMALSVARIRRIETVATGVATDVQTAVVRAAGVTLAQGAAYAAPVSAESFGSWLAAGREQGFSDRLLPSPALT